jgi:hypothetical protein
MNNMGEMEGLRGTYKQCIHEKVQVIHQKAKDFHNVDKIIKKIL